jgi:3'-5' exoribonuclease
MSSKPTRPAVTRLSDLKSGDRGTFFALLAERTRGATQSGKPFYTCRFRDARRTATYMVWADGPHFPVCDTEWQAGQFFKVRALYTEHERYGPQIDVEQIRPVQDRDSVEGFNPADLVERSRFDPDVMLAELRGLIQTEIADEPLRRLTLTLVDRYADRLKLLPASVRNYYPFPGGWLEHTLSVTRTALGLVDRYRERYPDLRPPLNRDLVVAGGVLHEVGRAAELAPVPGDAVEPTVDGRLLGHLFLGRDLVRDAAREQGDLNPDLLRLVEHMIVTHLNLPEWGSPRLPVIPEVLILHHADDLDAKLEMFARCLTRDPGPGPFTERDPVLGKQLFKGRSV